MSLKEEVEADVRSIISQGWSLADGQVVPETEAVALAGGGVNIDAAVLYADLADSTDLVTRFDRRIAAKVMKAFLAASTRIIRAHDGAIRSFDGDRVMGVFVGKSKNTSAATTALKINWAFANVVRPQLEAQYESLKKGFSLRHATGVDRGTLLVTRAGMRKNNDLIWVGRAANIAAKLSTIRDSEHRSYITASVYDAMRDEAKFHDRKAMWDKAVWRNLPGVSFYRSVWTWAL